MIYLLIVALKINAFKYLFLRDINSWSIFDCEVSTAKLVTFVRRWHEAAILQVAFFAPHGYCYALTRTY